MTKKLRVTRLILLVVCNLFLLTAGIFSMQSLGGFQALPPNQDASVYLPIALQEGETTATLPSPTSTATPTPTSTATPLPLFGTVLSITVESGYADSPDNASLDLGREDGEDFTIETFFYVPDLNYDDDFVDMLIRKDHSYSLYISFNSGSPDWLSFKLWTGFDTSVVLSYASDLSVGWHHVAAVFDNEFTENEDLMAIYLDGNRVAYSPDENIHVDWTPGILNSSSDLAVGGVPFGKAGFNGLIDEMRFSDVVRYSDASYMVPTVPFAKDTNTQALWHFDEAAGSTSFVDDSSNTNSLAGHDAQTSNP